MCWCSGGGGRGAGIGHLPERGAKFRGASSAWPGRTAGEGSALPLRSAPAPLGHTGFPRSPIFGEVVKSSPLAPFVSAAPPPFHTAMGAGARVDLASLIACLSGSYFSVLKCVVDLYHFCLFLCFPNKPSLEWPQSCGLSLWTVAFAAGCQAWNCIDRSRGTTAPVTMFPP